MKSLAMILAAAGLVVGGAVPAGGTTWDVNPGESIQTAIDGAADGDTVNVAAGTYTENLSLNAAAAKQLTLQGAGSGCGAGDTVIQSATAGSDVDVVHIAYGGKSATERLVLKDLRLTGGTGMGVEMGAAASVTISHITFDNVAAVSNDYAGIALNHVGDADDLVLDGCYLADNGKGFRVPSSLDELGSLSLTGCTVENNTGIGLIVYTLDAGSVSVTDCTFSGNSSGEHTGGDIVFSGYNGDLTIDNVTVNSSNADSGIRLSGNKHSDKTPTGPAGNVLLRDVTLTGTQAGTYPGAALTISRYTDGSSITFDNVGLNSTAPFGLHVGTMDGDLDLGGEVAFAGSYTSYDIQLGRHGDQTDPGNTYPLATVDIDAIGCGLTEADVWDQDDDPALGQVTTAAPPVPEPGVMGLVGLGLLSVMRRKRRS